ncbi:SURF1 family protein [Altererythrobacter indicus]|uniref:SURF1-like protein n=2 Tax=Altericroceibacterium indicum TaxID=374177 RepID=A0A845AEV4_9SPHN|nr:SURF1 family protein [Altericroceibacterium indicum]MXP27086.1 SURF1 family protein [Altericroceibacterium indicum]
MIAIVFAGCFAALCIWQIERREWKHNLIAAVDSRIHAPPVTAPGPAEWPKVNNDTAAYRHVTVKGRYLPHSDVLTRAVSDLGAGYWVITPLDTGHSIIAINRGFIAQDGRKNLKPASADSVEVTGLLRITEPGGGFLRSNDPKNDKWYSRDVAAIAKARQWNSIGKPIAPYFIDADASANAAGEPVGGLTVVHFPDNHLVYALTWAGLMLMSLWAAWAFWRGKLLNGSDDEENHE